MWGSGQVAEKESGEKKWFENKRLPGLTHKAPDTSQVWDFCIKLNPECWIWVLSFLDTQVSLAPTHVSKFVSKLVTLSDFQSLVNDGRSNKKSSKNKVHLFSNLVSGRTLLTHENVYEGLNA